MVGIGGPEAPSRLWIATEVDAIAAQGISVLDYGCGPALIAATIEKHCTNVASYIGYDSAPSMLALAERLRPTGNGLPRRGAPSLSARYLSQEPDPSERYDVVVARHVLEHLRLPDARATLRRICGWTARRALIVFSVPQSETATDSMLMDLYLGVERFTHPRRALEQSVPPSFSAAWIVRSPLLLTSEVALSIHAP